MGKVENPYYCGSKHSVIWTDHHIFPMRGKHLIKSMRTSLWNKRTFTVKPPWNLVSATQLFCWTGSRKNFLPPYSRIQGPGFISRWQAPSFLYLNPGTEPGSRDMSTHAINRLINSSSSNALTLLRKTHEVVLKCLALNGEVWLRATGRNVTDLFQCQVLPSGLGWWWLGWPCGFPLEADRPTCESRIYKLLLV